MKKLEKDFLVQNPQANTQEYFQLFSKSILPFQNSAINLEKSFIQNRIQSEICDGSLKIQVPGQNMSISAIHKITSQIQTKNDIFNKDLQLLKWSLKKGSKSVRSITPRSQSCQSFRYRKREPSDFTQRDYEVYKNKQISAAKRLKNLKITKQKLKLLRQENEERKRQLSSDIERREKIEKQQTLEMMRKDKRERIKKKLKQFEKRKEERQKLLKQSTVKSNTILPKYKIIEQKYAEEQIFEKQRKRREHHEKIKRMFLENDPESVKAHEKEYLEHIRLKSSKEISMRSKTERSSPSKKQLQQNFRLYGQNVNDLKQKREQREKMKEYQKIVNTVKLKKSMTRHMQIEVAKDKAANPYKYHFFKNKQKDIEDEQIFKRFNKLPLDSDSKELGNKYFKQIKEINKNSSSRINSKIPLKMKTEELPSEKYKNYMGDVKKNLMRNPKNSIEALLRKYQKSKILQLLTNTSDEHRKNAIKKIGQWKKQLSNYEQSISTQNEIDQQFLKSIQQKLKAAAIL